MNCEWVEGPNRTLTLGALYAQGVFHTYIDPAYAAEGLAEYTQYIQRDEVHLNRDTPGLEDLCDKFSKEHKHSQDEVRYVLEGEGVFDIRDKDNNPEGGWMRIVVHPGDFILVPAGRYHRFFLTDKQHIKAVRLFKDASGWVPEYR